jgi:hypothetical protein
VCVLFLCARGPWFAEAAWFMLHGYPFLLVPSASETWPSLDDNIITKLFTDKLATLKKIETILL